MTPEERLRAAQETLDVAQEAARDAVRARDAAIRHARSEGVPASAIADALHVDRQIVYRILRKH